MKIDTASKSVTIKSKDGAVVTVVLDDATVLSKVKESGKAGQEYAAKGGMNTGHKLRRHAGEVFKLSLMSQESRVKTRAC
jgi:hypothetical protein